MMQALEAIRISKALPGAEQTLRGSSCTDVRFSIQRRWSRSLKSPATP
jgi:hypothetical protein